MSAEMFHPHLDEKLFVEGKGSMGFGDQLLGFLKLAIYIIVGFKLFQLTFMRYRKKRGIADRVERKYQYCHSQFIDRYSEQDAKLMQITIKNTIRNSQIEPSRNSTRPKPLKKSVTFDIDKNIYHDFKNQTKNSDDQFKDLQEKESLFQKVEKVEKQVEEKIPDNNPSVEPLESKQTTEQKKTPEQTPFHQIVEINQLNPQNIQNMEKLQQETQTSSLLENTNRQSLGTQNSGIIRSTGVSCQN